MNHRVALAGIALALGSSSCSLGGDLLVPSEFPTIQSAVLAAGTGDRVIVSAGLYLESVDTLGKAIVISGLEGAVLQAPEGARAFRITSGEGRTTVLEGLTIRGPGKGRPGGGVLIQSASPTIRRCVVRDARWEVPQMGGAISLTNGTLTIEDCTFIGNYAGVCDAGFGSDIGCSSSTLTVDRSLFVGADGFVACGGGHVGINVGSSAAIRSCRFLNGAAVFGAALMQHQSTLLVEDCEFLVADATDGFVIDSAWGGSATIRRSRFHGCTGGAIARAQATLTLESCTIDGCDMTSAFSPLGSALRLQDVSACGGSFDSWGAPFQDLGGNSITPSCCDADRPSCLGDGVNDPCAVLEWDFADANSDGIPDCCSAPAPCFTCAGDIVRDGVVDGVDLAALLGRWGTDGTGTLRCDLDGDGIVAGSDLALVLGTWGACP